MYLLLFPFFNNIYLSISITSKYFFQLPVTGSLPRPHRLNNVSNGSAMRGTGLEGLQGLSGSKVCTRARGLYHQNNIEFQSPIHYYDVYGRSNAREPNSFDVSSNITEADNSNVFR